MADMVRFKRTRTSMSKLHQVKATACSNKTSHGRHGPFQADTHIHDKVTLHSGKFNCSKTTRHGRHGPFQADTHIHE